MFRNRLFAFLLSFLCGTALCAQDNFKVYYSVEEALKSPDDVVKFYLDCEMEYDTLFFGNITKFRNLSSLTIVGYTGERLPEKQWSSVPLDSLFISECSDLIFDRFFGDLAASKSLKCLVIDECDLLEVPIEITYFPELTKLIITNCENLDLERSITNISACKNLRYLGIPVNQICEIPANIGLVNQIQVLDISNNIVFDLPETMASMSGLQSFMTEGNIFINPVNALAKVSSLKIKYLTVDNDISDVDRERLKKLFPNTNIVEKDPNAYLTDGSNDGSSDTIISDIQYGELKSYDGALLILSDAYLHYPDVFARPLMQFDSLLFDERYKDLSYANTYRITNNLPNPANAGGSPQLFYWKRKMMTTEKNKVAFNFYWQGEGYPDNTLWLNKEVGVFRGMYWVYDGDLKKKEFLKKYGISKTKQSGTVRTSNSNAVRMSDGVVWTDIRFYYDDLAKLFTIELKSTKGFDRFQAHPILENHPHPEISKDQYNKRFERYLRSLESRRKRFNSKLLKDKMRFKLNYQKQNDALWKAFSDNYFSPTEKQMTCSQWLEYYDMIVGNERQAIEASPVSASLMKRYLNLLRYVENPRFNSLMFDTVPVEMGLNFFSAQQVKQVVSRIYVVNTMNKTFSMIDGSLGVLPTNVFLGPSDDVAIIAFMRNGDVGVFSRDQYARIDFTDRVQDLEVILLNSKLATFGLIASEAGL